MEIPQQLKQKGIKFVLLEKQGKKPFQKDWTNKIIEYDNPELLIHLSNGGNYGVMGGGEKKLIIVDFDDDKVQEEAMKLLPETFMVKTGSGMLHLYYFSDNCDSFKAFSENMDTLCDVQGEGKQVVGSGSIHPNGNKYEVALDVDIKYIAYAELKAIISTFDRKPKKEEKLKQTYPHDKHIEDNFLDELKRKLSVKDVLNWIGVDTSRNPTQCPFHNSNGGKCLGFQGETCHCFHCDGSWNIFSLITDYKKCNFKDSLDILAKIGGMEKELEESRKRYIEKIKAESKHEYDDIRYKFIALTSGKEKNWGEASELLVDFIKEKMWIYTTKDDVKSEVWIYKDGVYVPQGKSEIKEFLRNLLENFYSTFIYNLVIAKIEPDTYIDIDKFFKTLYPHEIAVQNGILNIKTLELKAFSPEKIFFNKMPVIFDTAKTCPKIDKFLSDVLAKEDDRKVFYEICGFGLLDEYKFEKAFMYHGDGRNGKGKCIELKKRLFGIENCCSVQLSALKTDNFSVSELFGKRLNLAGDIGSQDLKETNMFKSCTGRDLISGKRKFLRDLHFQNYAKFVFACNELPMVYDLSKGFWDRWILLDFPYTFVTQEEYNKAEDKINLKIRDDDIIEKITTPEELSGLLNQALLSLHQLEENKKFSTTEGSEEVKARWIRKSNSFIAFCWDMIEDEYDGRITKKSLRKKYAEYCKIHKIAPKSDFVLKKVLQENYGATEIRGYEADLGLRNDYWEGIKWKN
jgi:P4 family phage/plasmid primase-like protien